MIEEARLYGDLKESAAWQRLIERVRAQRSRFMDNVSQRLMAGQDVPREEILARRAFYMGAMYALRHPEVAEQSLERAARKAWTMALAKAQESNTD